MQAVSKHAHIRIVQSRQNGQVKELRAALKKGSRTGSGWVAIEGFHLLEEALRSGLRVPMVFVREGEEALLDELPLVRETEILVLTPDVFASAVTTESPQGIAAFAVPRAFELEDVLERKNPLLAVSVHLQDPGNFGTLVRSAEAFGAAGVLAVRPSANIWNGKSLRASSGSAFRLPVLYEEQSSLMNALKSRGIRRFAATVEDGTTAQHLDLTGPVAILIGNEGSGLSPEIVAQCEERITIPCPGPVESLNAGVAASILLYEAARQRNSGEDTIIQ